MHSVKVLNGPSLRFLILLYFQWRNHEIIRQNAMEASRKESNFACLLNNYTRHNNKQRKKYINSIENYIESFSIVLNSYNNIFIIKHYDTNLFSTSFQRSYKQFSRSIVVQTSIVSILIFNWMGHFLEYLRFCSFHDSLPINSLINQHCIPQKITLHTSFFGMLHETMSIF